MVRLLLFILFLPFSSITFGQYCTSGGPSSTIDSNIESVTLNGSSGSINYFGCPGITGLETYTSQTVSLDAGQSYTLSIQFGTCAGAYPGVGEAWIDFNANQIFEPSESVGTWSGTPPTSVSNFTVNVPSGASTGQTKMRIIQEEGGSLPVDPCANFNWGSATDFNIQIINGIDCSSYIGDDTSNPRLINTYPFSETHDNSFCYSNQNMVYASPDVYYLVIPDPSFNSMEFSLCGSTFDTFLTVMDEDGNILAINDDHPDCNIQSKLSIYTSNQDSLYVIVEGWSSQSGIYTINIEQGSIGLNEIQNEQFIIYPNPTSSVFQLNNEKEEQLFLTDSKGLNVFNQVIEPFETIDISFLPDGIYFAQMKSQRNYLKIIKQ